MKVITRTLMGVLMLSGPMWAHAISMPTVSIFQVGDSGELVGAVGGTAIFSGNEQHVGGTGVFSPFLSLQNYPIERAYNAGNGNLFMDNTRPSWNSQLRVGDLQRITVGNAQYYLFALDANEPGNRKSYISIDNIRIYTSSSDTSASVQNDAGNTLDGLGTLRFSMNDPLRANDGSYSMANWVNLDSRLGSEPAGSGLYDMLTYIPVSAFGDAAASDYLWFYNLNGVHVSSDSDLAAESGFEEWRAFTGPSNYNSVPDASSTVMLLGVALLGLEGVRRKLAR